MFDLEEIEKTGILQDKRWFFPLHIPDYPNWQMLPAEVK